MRFFHQAVELLYHLRILTGQIVTLGYILTQVIKFEWGIGFHRHALPVASAGCTLFSRKLPVEHTVVGIHLLSIEQRQDIDAVDLLWNYTVEVRNRFKGLDVIDRVPDELWMEVRDVVQETGIKTIPKKKNCKKAKWLSEEALQIAVK